MNFLISIIIPVYNSEKFIEQTLQSCLDQTYELIEIIIVNDGSNDNSEKIIKNFKDSRISYFKIENSGPSYARNYGLKQSRGDLIQFLDADDILDKKKLEKQICQYEIYGEQFIYSGIMGSIIGREKRLESNLEFYYKDLEVKEYFYKMFNHFGCYYTTGMWLVPKFLLKQTHGWEEKIWLNDDGEYFSRIILHSKGIRFCPGAIFYYRKDVPGSVSKKRNGKHIYEGWLFSCSCYVKNFLLKLDSENAKRLGRKALSVYYCNSYPHYPEFLIECKDQIKHLGYRKPVAHGGKIFKWISTCVGVETALKIREFKKKIIA